MSSDFKIDKVKKINNWRYIFMQPFKLEAAETLSEMFKEPASLKKVRTILIMSFSDRNSQKLTTNNSVPE